MKQEELCRRLEGTVKSWKELGVPMVILAVSDGSGDDESGAQLCSAHSMGPLDAAALCSRLATNILSEHRGLVTGIADE